MTVIPLNSMKSASKICHLTSIHPPFDIRIFHKECKTLAQAGFEVYLIAPHVQANTYEGIHVLPIPQYSARWRRMLFAPWQVFRVALRLHAKMYHLHVPELLPIGLLLRCMGKKVIYDVHENVPGNISEKHYLPGYARFILSRLAQLIENVAKHAFTGIVAAEPPLAQRFQGPNTILVNNYPLQSEMTAIACTPYQQRPMEILYLGAMHVTRGLLDYMDALAILLANHIPVRLQLAGKIPSDLLAQLQQHPAWPAVDNHGTQDRPGVLALLNRARIGLCVLHPMKNYLYSQPTKLYEYWAFGMPVITSNFPAFESLLSHIQGGLTVPAKNHAQLAQALMQLLNHSADAEAMGKQAQRTVLQDYMFENEGKKLVEFYQRCLKTT